MPMVQIVGKTEIEVRRSLLFAMRVGGAFKAEPPLSLFGQVIVSHDLIGRLMLLAARSPWIAPVLTSLMGFEGSEFYFKVRHHPSPALVLLPPRLSYFRWHTPVSVSHTTCLRFRTNGRYFGWTHFAEAWILNLLGPESGVAGADGGELRVPLLSLRRCSTRRREAGLLRSANKHSSALAAIFVVTSNLIE